MNLNPAMTGLFKGDVRLGAIYRRQWQSVPVPYLTFSGGFDQKVALPFSKTGYLGAGLLFNFDKAGDGDFRIIQLGLNAAYTQKLSDNLFISVGGQFSLGQRAVNPNQLTYAEQWNGDIFDSNIAHTEQFDDTSIGMNSLSSGLNLHYQIDGTRTKFDLGISAYHINQPKESFFDNPEVVLPMKGNNYALATLQMRENMDLRFHALFTYMGLDILQSEYNETVAGLAIRYHLNTQPDQELSVQPGFSFRLGDALIPNIEIQYRVWLVGISYDVNISQFKAASLRRGGPEISVQYILTKVKNPEVFKACPIF